MKKTLFLAIVLSFLSFLSPQAASPAAMTDYCVVPPYVIQNISPNVMLLLDNSHSMLEFSYDNPAITTTTAADFVGDSIIEVADVSRFQVDDLIAIYTSENFWAGGASNWNLEIDAINTATKQLTVSYNMPLTYLKYNAGTPVVLKSRGGRTYEHLPYFSGNGTCAETTTRVAGTDDDFNLLHTFAVTSTAGFAVGDRIAIQTDPRVTAYWEGGYNDISLYAYGEMVITAIGANTISVSYGADSFLDYTAGAPIILIQKAGVGSPICNRIVSFSGTNHTVVNSGVRAYDASFNSAGCTTGAETTGGCYYGYFSPTHWYTYSAAGGGRFAKRAAKSASAKQAADWDGSFLNWLLMRRIDVVRRALTGGAPSGSCGGGCTTLGAEKADCGQRGKSMENGVYKSIKASFNVQNYIDTSLGNGTRCFQVLTADDAAPYTCDGGGSGTASFKISTDANCTAYAASNYSAQAATTGTIEGVLQDIVGTRARLGLAFFNPGAADNGSFVQVSIGGASLSSTVNQINITRPNASTTPLAEALWTITGYYAQDNPYSDTNNNFSTPGGPGPMYQNGNYQINNLNDPLNYGTGGSPRWPKCAKSFVLLLTDGEPCGDSTLPDDIAGYAQGKSVFNCGGKPKGTGCPQVTQGTASFPAQTIPGAPTCGGGNLAGLEDVALWAHTKDLRDTATMDTHTIEGSQTVNLFMVHAFGSGSTLLKYASINGGFDDNDGSLTPNTQGEWDENGDNVPDTFYEASDGNGLEQGLKDALSSMLRRAASGTAASVLASGEGSGANLIQAVFYPRRRFGNDIVQWTGSLHNFWYYVDPQFGDSNIREDTNDDQVLDLQDDYIVIPFFDTSSQTTKAHRFQDTDGDGDADVTLSDVLLENIDHLWEAGRSLFTRNLSTDPRQIYANLNGTGFTPFVNSSAATFQPYLDVVNATDAANVIDFVHGNEVWVDKNLDGFNDWRSRIVNSAGVTAVYKLGDILNSTPKIVSWIPLHLYDKGEYADTTYKQFHKDLDANGDDLSLPADSSLRYGNRGMVFTGGNDGMLHAVKLGKLELEWTGQTDYEKGRLSGTDLGKELWSFIPKNALPYLKYIPDVDYCHIYGVDLTPFIVDVSIGIDADTDDNGTPDQPATCTEANYHKCVKSRDSWRTILIGGMRTGGACRKTGTACADVAGTPFTGDTTKDCVNTPRLDPADGTKGLGYSSYFAIDITDPENPVFLWEFSNDALGYATTGPAIVRIADKAVDGSVDNNNNGKWYAVFGSGPTGPVYEADYQFLGRSDQNLKYFVLDLRTGALLRTIDTGIQYAFSGSMLNVNIDPDRDYQDDVLYVGYTQRAGSNPYYWTNGGLLRLFTNEDLDPANWVWSKLMDGIGAVTASTVNLHDWANKKLWIYFGTGRYFFDIKGADDDDDIASQRRIFGVTEPCFLGKTANPTFNAVCTDTNTGNDLAVAIGSLTEAATSAGVSDGDGWYINLDAAGSYEEPEGSGTFKDFNAERIITDPVAMTSGLVFFTSYKPYDDECGLGGKSYIWAMNYKSGGSGGSLLTGKALIQVSTGSIEQLDLKEAFTTHGDRRSASLEGVPPLAQGLALISTPPPLKRVVHIKEK